jgi:hypothetical protein
MIAFQGTYVVKKKKLAKQTLLSASRRIWRKDKNS